MHVHNSRLIHWILIGWRQNIREPGKTPSSIHWVLYDRECSAVARKMNPLLIPESRSHCSCKINIYSCNVLYDMQPQTCICLLQANKCIGEKITESVSDSQTFSVTKHHCSLETFRECTYLLTLWPVPLSFYSKSTLWMTCTVLHYLTLPAVKQSWGHSTGPTDLKVDRTFERGGNSGYYSKYRSKQYSLQECSFDEAVEHCTEQWNEELYSHPLDRGAPRVLV